MADFYMLANQRHLDSERQKLEAEKDTIRATIKNKRRQKIELDKIDKDIAKLEKEQHNKMITIRQLALAAETAIAIARIVMAAEAAKAMALVQVLGNPLHPAYMAMVTATNSLTAKQIATTVAANSMAAGLLQAQRFAKGGEFITQKPELIMVGEAGREHVQITPIDRPPERALGSNPITINFSGNVMSQDFIENEAIPQIKEAIRRGADIGVS